MMGIGGNICLMAGQVCVALGVFIVAVEQFKKSRKSSKEAA